MSILRILIPVDLKVASLKTLKLVLEKHESDQLHITLLFPRSLNESISELLFFSEFKVIQQHISREFKEGLEVLRNRFKNSIQSMEIRLLAYDNQNYFNAFIEHNKIDIVFYPDVYQLDKKVVNIEINSVIRKSGLKAESFNWQSIATDEIEALAELMK